MANLRELLENTVQKHENNIAFTLKLDKEKYLDITYKEFLNQVRGLASAILKKGMGGARISIIGKNSYEWFLANASIYYSGSISVPLDKELEYGEFENSLIIGEMDYLFYDKKLKPFAEKAMAEGKTKLKGIIALYQDDSVYNIYNMRDEGLQALKEGDTAVDQVVIDDHGVSLLLFTSGTTSQAKAVMLAQHGIAINAMACVRTEPFTDHDTSIALLPYHHIFGSTGQWVVLESGSRTVYCDGLKYIQKNLKEYGVSIFIGVPLIMEAMYKKVLHTAEKEGKLETLKKGRKIANFLLKFGIDVRRKLFKSVLDGLGGKLRFVIIGAAPISPESLSAFTDFGIVAVQGYGLTETSPVVAAERLEYRRSGSVGIAMDGNEIKISEPNENGIGEITVRGENVMLGYLNNPEATNAVLKDGWFYTGDLGYMDKDGYLFITGRKKNVIVLKNGKNVFPEELEAILEKKPYQKELVVLGVPRHNDPKDLAVTLKIVYNEDYFEGKSFEEIDSFIRDDIDKFNEDLPPYKRIMRIIVTGSELIKTTTGKVKRYAEIEEILKAENEKQA